MSKWAMARGVAVCVLHLMGCCTGGKEAVGGLQGLESLSGEEEHAVENWSGRGFASHVFSQAMCLMHLHEKCGPSGRLHVASHLRRIASERKAGG